MVLLCGLFNCGCLAVLLYDVIVISCEVYWIRFYCLCYFELILYCGALRWFCWVSLIVCLFVLCLWAVVFGWIFMIC